MKRMLLAALVAAAALLANAPARAEPAAQPLPDGELAGIRAGILTPLGLEIGFAATVRTYVDDQLALETRLSWTEQGVLTSVETAGGGGPAALPDLTGTEIRHMVDADRIVSVVLNTASDRNIRQATDVVLSVPQLGELQAQVAAGRLLSGLETALGLALREQR
jgi:hypothetical protein